MPANLRVPARNQTPTAPTLWATRHPTALWSPPDRLGF
jgi:hypothetical protein